MHLDMIQPLKLGPQRHRMSWGRQKNWDPLAPWTRRGEAEGTDKKKCCCFFTCFCI